LFRQKEPKPFLPVRGPAGASASVPNPSTPLRTGQDGSGTRCAQTAFAEKPIRDCGSAAPNAMSLSFRAEREIYSSGWQWLAGGRKGEISPCSRNDNSNQTPCSVVQLWPINFPCRHLRHWLSGGQLYFGVKPVWRIGGLPFRRRMICGVSSSLDTEC